MPRIHLGCGGQLPGITDERDCDWINVDLADIDVKALPRAAQHVAGGFPRYVKSSMVSLPFPDGFADECYSHHALEHLTPDDAIRSLREQWRVLRAGGIARHNVPDLLSVAKKLVDTDGDVDWSLMGERTGDRVAGYTKLRVAIYGEGYGPMGHRNGFTPRSLTAALQEAGFRDVAVRQLWAMETFCLEVTGVK